MKIRPLQNKIVAIRKNEDTSKIGSIFIPDTAQEKSDKCEILACGPGKTLSNGTIIEPSVKPGDVVLVEKNRAREFKLDGETYVILTEDIIIGVYE